LNKGGSDFAVPLSILNIIPNSISDLAGLKPGDAIVKINDVETSWMEHSRAKQELIRSGNEIKLTIKRQAVDITKPQFTPLAQLKSKQPVNPATYTPPPPAPKTNLTVEKTVKIHLKFDIFNNLKHVTFLKRNTSILELVIIEHPCRLTLKWEVKSNTRQLSQPIGKMVTIKK